MAERRNELDKVYRKIYRSEKHILRELGIEPKKKNRTGTLIHYTEILYPSEQELLVEIINKNSNFNIHLGLLPFMNRDTVLDILLEAIRPFGKFETSIKGLKADLFLIDEYPNLKELKKLPLDTKTAQLLYSEQQSYPARKQIKARARKC